MTTDGQPETHDVMRALNRLAKWRMIFAGWQLGTRPKGDPESDAVRDHREVTMLLRAEVSALVNILTEHNVMTEEEWAYRLGVEADALSKMYEDRFPGMKATDDGIDMDLDTIRAKGTMKGWRP